LTTHLEDYLSYYQKLENPGYAVLVTGEWGTGKTFQVLKYLSEDQRYYVSLFGTRSSDEVHALVLAETAPIRAMLRQTTDGIGKTAKDMGGIFALGGLLPGVANAVLRQDIKPDRTLVLDDLERSCLKLKEVFGVINAYVEQHGFRVIVIAHDKKLAKKFNHMKEKLIGQTIRVEPQVSEAFDKFASDIKPKKLNEFITGKKDAIIHIFDQSKAKSLRVLRHVIEDLGRLHGTLTTKHLANKDALMELVNLFCAINIEFRMGHLQENDLQNRGATILEFEFSSHGANKTPRKEPGIVTVNKKYLTIDLENNLLNDDVVVQTLVEGRYLKEVIRESLDNNPYFFKPKKEPPWKIVISFDKLEDEIVTAAAKRMEKQFKNREVIDSGEMLHIFSLRMMMCEHGIIDGNINEVFESCKKYIDDLLKNNTLPSRGTDWDWYNSFQRGHAGQSYWTTEATKKPFKEISKHLLMAREKALENKFPALTEKLLDYVKTDGEKFLEMVCFTNNGENPYAQIPILAHINPKVFVDVWLGSPHANWRYVSWALKGRYENGRIKKELETEEDWAIEVYKNLQEEAAKASGFLALRIHRTIPSELKSLSDASAKE
jgi:KAP family P-loop domain